jgi:cytochrome P450
VLIKMRFLPATHAYYAALRRLDMALLQRIRARQGAAPMQSDVLALLLGAHQVDAGEQALTVPEVRDQMMTLFFAGHETLASALPWAWLSLAQYPHVAEQMYGEVDRVLGGRLPTAADVPQLRYTMQVFQETLRLYPPIIALSRRVEEPLEVAGYPIGVGSHLYMSQFVVHRDGRWWPDPLCFDPDRFAPSVAESRPRFAYFPFGGGPRQCIGEGFATVEGVITLAAIAQRWRVSVADTTVPAFSSNIITLRPKKPLMLRVHKR